ncbi:MAG: 5-methyltetrahydropteroyltriglutamate--homocysteine S-methyltransferase, partial [Planctomycetes bacterium]|nr:5-methyltetrahydropteroyltriglutamate--homocysteine S-methyltransferase [Planctomycetota bacterium]
MTTSSNLGFPRIGPNRELKKALESYWAGRIGPADLESAAVELRKRNWLLQRDAGLHRIPSNDFSYYDHVLDTCAMVGAVPERYGWDGGPVDLDTYFAMARGTQGGHGARDVVAMEMTKWFDTNYHYIVPELAAGQTFTLASTKPVDEFTEAFELGIQTRPVLLGPVSFLLLSKSKDTGAPPLDLLDGLLPVYQEILTRLGKAGASWVQMDEPCLVGDLDSPARAAYERAYRQLRDASSSTDLKLLLTTYFGEVTQNLDTITALPVDGLHVDLVRGADQLDAVMERLPDPVVLSAGVVDGRNVWVTDLKRALNCLQR